MGELRFLPVDEAGVEDWRHVHNTVVPTHPLTADDVRDRIGRHRLELAYAGDVLVGCSTVRPPDPGVEPGTGTATVIVRVLPEHRRRGYGNRLLARAMTVVAGLAAGTVETVVLASNPDGLRFALDHGFAEIERYVLPGESVAFIDLRLDRPDR